MGKIILVISGDCFKGKEVYSIIEDEEDINGSILALKIWTDIKTRAFLKNMDNKFIKNQRKIASLSYLPRSLSSTNFTQIILYDKLFTIFSVMIHIVCICC